MNIIFHGFQKKSLSSITFKILNDFDINYATFIPYSNNEIEQLRNKKINVQDHKQYMAGKYNADFNTLIPLDEQLIFNMRNCETIALKMMDRQDSQKKVLTYGERKRLYLRHLRYWNHIITTNKIDCFIASNVPHEVFDYVIYELCLLNKIPVLYFHQSALSASYFRLTDFKTFMPEIRLEFEKLLSKYSDEQIELSPSFSQYFNSHFKMKMYRFT